MRFFWPAPLVCNISRKLSQSGNRSVGVLLYSWIEYSRISTGSLSIGRYMNINKQQHVILLTMCLNLLKITLKGI